MFRCDNCDEIKDADDGCDESPRSRFELICIDCMDERDAAEENDIPPQQPTEP
jgi:hypothetical protein